MKKSTLILIMLTMFSLGSFAQLVPIGWFSFGDQPDFADNPYEWKDTAIAVMAPEEWDWDAATLDFDALWESIEDEYEMTNHAKDGDDLFDGGTTAGSSCKLIYDENALYVLLQFTDLFGQFTDHGWEVAIQTFTPDRYEPDFTAAGDDVTLRNQSYARYCELGGKKIRFQNGQIDECNGSFGAAETPTWGNVGIALEQLVLADNYLDDQLAASGVLKVGLVLEYTVVMGYLTDPMAGDLENIADYTAFDPAEKPVISFDVKSIGNTGENQSHYWWNAHQDEAYICTYYCGLMKFEPADTGGATVVSDVVQADIRAYVSNDILRFTNTERIDVDIYSITGQLMKSARNVTQVNVGDLKRGIYIAQLRGMSKAVKFMK
ncbi:MAG: hypothetical protein AMS26_10000 [Bacteroides sp. SM23_62]|nr:MAG: hypothetical protein AMS26_10000 [Bacteroides sp. SM23_62]